MQRTISETCMIRRLMHWSINKIVFSWRKVCFFKKNSPIMQSSPQLSNLKIQIHVFYIRLGWSKSRLNPLFCQWKKLHEWQHDRKIILSSICCLRTVLYSITNMQGNGNVSVYQKNTISKCLNQHIHLHINATAERKRLIID